jgi:hypothetical protein
MKNFRKFFALAVLTFVLATSVSAQEWTKEQTEVWTAVQDMWKGWQSGDPSAVSSALHEKYQGWSDQSPLPMSRETTVNWFTTMKDAMSIPYYSIEPARIVVLKSTAVVHYYYYFNLNVTMGDKPESEEVKGKTTEFYVKEGDKWLLLGDMMVHEEDD